MTPHEKAAAVVVAGMPAGAGLRRRARPPVEHGAAAPARRARLRRSGGRHRRRRSARLRPGGLRPHTAARPRLARPGRQPRRRCDGLESMRPSPRCSTCRTARSAPVTSPGPEYGVAFARGLGRAACAKHFPGLGSTPASTDEARVYGVLRSAGSRTVPRRDPGGRAVRDGRSCDLSAARHAPRLARAEDLRLLRELGFAAWRSPTRSEILASPLRPTGRSSPARGSRPRADDERRATRAGSSTALVPLARAGELDAKLVRVLRYRRLVDCTVTVRVASSTDVRLP